MPREGFFLLGLRLWGIIKEGCGGSTPLKFPKPIKDKPAVARLRAADGRKSKLSYARRKPPGGLAGQRFDSAHLHNILDNFGSQRRN